jgi:protein AbiQ
VYSYIFRKEVKLDELLFYTVDANYIKFLSKFEKHVSYNKNEIGHSRPYLGIVIKVEDYEYFVPLYSYKEHYNKYKNNPSFFFIYDRNDIPIAIMKFSAMIPVPKGINVINLLNFNNQNVKYQSLVASEYRYVNSHKEEIYKRANKMYIAVTKNKENFLKTIACNFKLLEEKCREYKNGNRR